MFYQIYSATGLESKPFALLLFLIILFLEVKSWEAEIWQECIDTFADYNFR